MATRKFVVGKTEDVAEGAGMLVTVANRSIGIFKVGGEFYGLMNKCPHLGGELCKGRLTAALISNGPGDFHYDPETALIMCPWHGWEYDVRTGQSYLNPKTQPARPYQVQVENGGEVTIELDEGRVGVVDTERGRVGQAAPRSANVAARVADRTPGPYTAETVSVTVDGDYIVVNLDPVRSRPAAAKAKTEENA
jgi:3-phenylpropionate/trans-cinnamate dioxygenase ferredoxin subunit